MKTTAELSKQPCRMAVTGAELHDVTYKVLLVGDSGVGKTALIRSLMGQAFKPNHMATVGVDFVKKTFAIDGARIQLEIWDTAGQERFRTITRFQYRGTKGLLLVYDITSRNSFSMLNYWLSSIDREIDQCNKEPVPVFIIGNKTDLMSQRAIPTSLGKQVAENYYVHGFLETSAKDGINVYKSFSGLAQAVTEVHHPKMMNSYLTPDERMEKEMQRMGQIFCSYKGSSQLTKQDSFHLKPCEKKEKQLCNCG